MKLRYIVPLLLIITACNKTPKLELTVKAPEIADGLVTLKQAGTLAFNEPFKNGELSANKQLQSPGYYQLNIINNNAAITTRPGFDVYLENGAYTIELQKGKPDAYPNITTTSATQKELTEYYKLDNQMAGAVDQQIDSLSRYLKTAAAAKLSKNDRADIYTHTRAIQKQRRELDLQILQKYISEHPNNKIAAHIMNQQYVAENPTGYNAVFQKFSADLKTSDDGLKIGNKLMPLLGVLTNAAAPEIVGSTPKGAPFSKSMVNKKAILVEFWKPSNSTSRLLHQQLIQGIILTPADQKNLAILSVSIDENRAAWMEAIKDEHKEWLDISDLKGDSSPNVSAWGIKAVPAFYILDNNWHMIKAGVDFADIDTEVHEYLKKH
ncbi:hypothetical protein A0256_04410 [Mucilaginibacter sp. PAMC 26640]|nr:hypothetical protein A0256_04410 [Mucilaginibacter sp. PAMC 26640]